MDMLSVIVLNIEMLSDIMLRLTVQLAKLGFLAIVTKFFKVINKKCSLLSKLKFFIDNKFKL